MENIVITITREDLIKIINDVIDHDSETNIIFTFSPADILRLIKNGIEKEYEELKKMKNKN